MELLATVHWVITREDVVTVDDAISKTYAWNDRKRMFQKEHIKIAWEIMKQKGWMKKTA